MSHIEFTWNKDNFNNKNQYWTNNYKTSIFLKN